MKKEFWILKCLFARLTRPDQAAAVRGQKVLQLFFSIFLKFSFVCLIYVWKIHDPTSPVPTLHSFSPGQLLFLFFFFFCLFQLQLLQLK